MKSNSNVSQEAPSSFLSCDWGTSSFRLKLVETHGQKLLGETRRDIGVKSIYTQSSKEKKGDRSLHFESFLIRESLRLLESVRHTGHSIPLMLSGMITSSIGWVELPYARTPFALNGSGAVLQSKEISCPSGLHIDCRLISGVQSKDEMMRGEETELMGLFSLEPYRPLAEDCLAILPGSHSKHVRIQHGSIKAMRTYMTGELLEVLARHSILQTTVDFTSVFEQGFQWTLESQSTAYRDGIQHAQRSGLLGNLFQARARGVLYDTPGCDNIWFLMGLLIGEEIIQMKRQYPDELPILIAAGKRFSHLYREAACVLDLEAQLIFVKPQEMEMASTEGHRLMLRTHTGAKGQQP